MTTHIDVQPGIALQRPGARRPPQRRDGRLALVFLAPALFFYIGFLIIPLIGTLFLSFTDWEGFTFDQLRMTGLDNYRQMAGDDVFWAAVRHNLILVVAAAVLKTVIALALAIILDNNVRFARFFQTVYLMPAVVSLVVTGVVFSLALSPTLGFVNPLLDAIGLSSLTGDWLGDTGRALPTIVVVEVWHTFGLHMTILIASLAGIPGELRESARVDGATTWQEYRHIVIPMLRPAIGVVFLLAGIESFKIFATIYVMTRGGPSHATEVLSTWGFFQAFSANNVGYGSAIMVVLLLLTFALSVLQVRSNRRAQNDLA
ncbi:carbohydrate ABC transporter permease [Jiangella asiatica]|uniref:Sugar ABC transporter permease n=1 Tax=Jiangella asiatica TaxID=2530372 RepID=A0A4R5CLE5_9ACTN|nr:sugar ABC transporter permease [Jiangella asiatica]TDE01169.1 sugar ABC transporter permease [Jiangella asiatica]